MAKNTDRAKMRSNNGKTELIWDRNKRIDFVTGFKKRKDERRKVAKEQQKQKEAEERRERRKGKQQ